ncbi:MAG TPA: terminase TerL endonuclease subunit, partial [Arenicellales bacterium]|nr:terminase TerL endonuclease subunit [Arenicellales bacterium]
DRWDTVEALKKANPNFGVSVDEDYLLGKLAQARRSASRQNAFKTKHLNLWVGAKTAWMNMLALQATRRKRLALEDFRGRRCFIGIDLASKIDIADLAILFPPEAEGGKYTCFWRHYLPEDRILDGGNTRYKAWHADGWLTSTPGNVTDFGYIEDDLRELRDLFEIAEVAFDPFNATQFSTRMLEEGFPMVQYGATVKNFSEPMKLLEALVLEKRWQMPADPVATWMFGNVVARLDKKDNIFPDKERPENKIDGVVAAISALARAIVDDEPDLSEFLAAPLRT